MNKFDPQSYGPQAAELITAAELMPLDPGTPNEQVRGQLESLRLESLFAGQPIADQDMAACCQSGLWLLHNYLDESHRISQSIDTPCGSYWHGIMHRREPDFSNAKYWFRRVGHHPVFAPLNEQARAASEGHADVAAQFIQRQPRWDPYRFIDLCENALRGQSKGHETCRLVAQVEWQVLFDYCYRHALAG